MARFSAAEKKERKKERERELNIVYTIFNFYSNIQMADFFKLILIL